MIKVRKHYSLCVADRLLRVLSAKARLLPSAKDASISVQAWANGREQGYSVQLYETNQQAVFAQVRNGDSIVVINGLTWDFDISTNMPDDKIWETNRRFFDHNDFDSAVNHILESLQVGKLNEKLIHAVS